ncbi:unnamed protein product [Closterium sp. NIES-65]|nr:unnamed protein product [Closterium sp. NIES-65]
MARTGFVAIGIRFENTTGRAGNQAVAFRQSADNAAFYECEFFGSQDTLYAHVNTTGWMDWVGTVYNTSMFIERGNSGPGSVGPRIAWALPGIVTDPAQVAMYYPNSFLAPLSTIAKLIPFPWL